MGPTTDRAVLYLRVSTLRQERGASIGTQRSILTDWVKTLTRDSTAFPRSLVIRHDLEFQDAKSGKDDDRPQFKALLVAAKRGDFEHILCFDTDRFARDLKLTLIAIDDLAAMGVKVHFYNLQHVDIYSSEGRTILQQLAMYAEQFRQRHSYRMKAAMRAKMMDRREWVGRPPFGWKVNSTAQGQLRRTLLEKHPTEWVTVQFIFLAATEKRSLSSIATELNGNKATHPTRAAKQWTAKQVSSILNHPRTRKAMHKEQEEK